MTNNKMSISHHIDKNGGLSAGAFVVSMTIISNRYKVIKLVGEREDKTIENIGL